MRRVGPVDLIERAANVRHLEVVLRKDLLRPCDFVVRNRLQILSPDLAQLHPVKSKLLADDVTRMVEIVRHFIGDYTYLELRSGGPGTQRH